MNYEERYKQAIEAAKRELHCCGSLDCDAARQIFRLFPELKESDSNGKSTDIRCDITEWLKSIKGRVQPQSKQEYGNSLTPYS